MERNGGGDPIDRAEEVAGRLVVSGGNGPLLFEFGKEVLDHVSILV